MQGALHSCQLLTFPIWDLVTASSLWQLSIQSSTSESLATPAPYNLDPA